MKIKMKGKHIKITIIQCYAPTNDSEKESKDAFYDQLQGEPWGDASGLNCKYF